MRPSLLGTIARRNASYQAAGGGGGGPDPALGDLYWPYVVTLLHLDGTDGQTTTVDEAAASPTHNWTFASTAALKTAQKKFGTASLRCNGGTESIYSNADTDLHFGLQDFTVELWVRPVGYAPNASYSTLIARDDGVSSDREWWFRIGGNASAYSFSQFAWTENAAVFNNVTIGYTFLLDTWYHIAYCRHNHMFVGFVDGVMLQQTSADQSPTVNLKKTNVITCIGTDAGSNGPSNVYIDDVRITKGKCRYSGTFEPQRWVAAYPHYVATDPYIANVVSLMHGHGQHGGTTVVDTAPASPARAWTMIGGAYTYDLTPQQKWTDGCLALNLASPTGGERVNTTNSDDFAFGTGDFTVEFFARPSNLLAGTQTILSWSTAAGPIEFNLAGSWPNNQLRVYVNTDNIIDLTAQSPQPWLKTGIWHHFAVTREGDVWRAFVDGYLYQQVTDSRSMGSPNHANGINIGAETTGPSQYFIGLIAEVRVTKGVCRYTSEFVPPQQPFPDS